MLCIAIELEYYNHNWVRVWSFMIKYVICLLILLPNLCMAEYFEYEKLPPLKKYSSVSEEINFFEIGKKYHIELDIPNEFFL